MRPVSARNLFVRPLAALHAALAVMILAPAAYAGDPSRSFVEGELLVSIASRAQSTRAVTAVPVVDPARVADGVGELISYHPALGIARIRVLDGISLVDAARNLVRRAGVRYAEPNYIRRIASTPDDPKFSANQWAPQQIQMESAWDLWTPRAQRVIAIIDTGVDMNHPDLSGVIYRDNNGKPVGYNAQNPASSPIDENGHGTHVAGIAAAQINNAQGIAGIAGWNPSVTGSSDYVRVMPVRVLDASGMGTDLHIVSGIVWAVNNGASVINLSLGASSESAALNEAVAYAIRSNVVVVASAGNSSSDSRVYPAACPDVISVAAADSADTLASFSNHGSWVKTAAPGVGIHSTYLSSTYADMSGTSLASAHVAGAAILIRSSFPSYSNAQISNFLTNHTDPVHSYAGRTIAAGGGRLNVYKALLEASGGLVNLTFSPGTVTGGADITGTVSIGSPAPAEGKVILLSSASASVNLPASVSISGGDTSATFLVGTNPVPIPETVIISVDTAGYSIESAIIILPPEVDDLWMRPAGVTGGAASTGTVTLNGPAPVGGLSVSLSSSLAGVSVPAYVVVPQGALTADFNASTVPVSDTTAVTITATTRTLSLAAVLTVASPVPVSVEFDPSTVGVGYNTTAVVTLKGPAAAGGVTVNLSSDTLHAIVPSSVLVPEGETEFSFTVQTTSQSPSVASLASDLVAIITATANDKSAAGSLTIRPVLKSVSINPTSCFGGTTSTGTVTLNVPAPAGGVVVSLSTSNPAASVPVNVTVPEGQTSATFTVSTIPVSVNTRGPIFATHNSITKQSITLTVTRPALSSITFTPTTVVSGAASTGKLTLNGAAPTGYTATITTSNSDAAPVPTTVTFAAGATTATFTVTGGTVLVDTDVTITGKLTDLPAKSATLRVAPPPATVSSITYSPAVVFGGDPSTGTVTLTRAAPTGGTTVTLTSNHASASVPASVKVPAGSLSITFTITTTPVAVKTTGTFTATASGVSKLSGKLTVKSPVFSHITFNPTLIARGQNATGTITLNSKAPAGYTITLTSSNTTAAPVPGTVTFAANATTATFTVTGGTVAARTTVTITGRDPAGIARSVSLDVKP